MPITVKNREFDFSRFAYDPDTGVVTRRLADGTLKPFGTLNHHGYLQGRICGVYVAVHRLAWRLHHGVWPEGLLDHRDKVKTNNRIGNLREATHAENVMNMGKLSTNRTGYKGVAFDRNAKSSPWRARIMRDGRMLCLGSFDTAEDAAAAYDQAAVVVHGEHASPNADVTDPDGPTKRVQRKNAHGLRGVTYHERNPSRPWKAVIYHDGKTHLLGYFPTSNDAANAYDEAAFRLKPAGKRRLNNPIRQLIRVGFSNGEDVWRTWPVRRTG